MPMAGGQGLKTWISFTKPLIKINTPMFLKQQNLSKNLRWVFISNNK